MVEGKTYRLQPGDLLVISDREIHRDSEKARSAATGILPILTALFLEEAKSRIATGGFITVL